MKRIIYFLITGTLTGCILLLMSSCSEDFLEKQPPGVAAGTIIETETGVESLLIGAYDMLRGKNMWGGGDLATEWQYGSVASDDAYKGTTYDDNVAFNAIERFETFATNSYLAARWEDCYNGVSRANDVLQFFWNTQEGDNPVPEPRASQIEAEAKFLRAWFHIRATKTFRNIPYIKTSGEMDGMLPEDVPNDSEGWEYIEEDLQFAIANLPASKPLGEVGRACSWSAKAVLAHVYLYQNKFAQAKPLLDDIIDNGPFELVDNYNDNYIATRNNNEESIFELQSSVTSETSGSYFLNNRVIFHRLGAASFGWGFFQPSQDLFEAYQTNGGLPVLNKDERVALAHDQGVSSEVEFIPTDHPLDPRVDYTISRRGIDFLGWGIAEGMAWIRDQANGGPYMTKKFHFTYENRNDLAESRGRASARNFRAYRLTHIILWRAEVAVEDGDLELARDLVNQIRQRARNSEVVMGRVNTYIFDGREVDVDWDLPAANYEIELYPADHEAFADQANAKEAVRVEHRLEFATEGKRFFQLRRWGIMDEVLNEYIEKDGEFRIFMRNASFNAPKDEYWPIPQAQLDIQSVLNQDPNY